MDVLITMSFYVYGSESHPISNISHLLHAQVSSFPNLLFHAHQPLTDWSRAINPLKLCLKLFFLLNVYVHGDGSV
jgi:hypothetical protein